MKKPTVTVAVCAYNEEKNIGKFLQSVLMQQAKLFKLEKILVISDGSSDKTVDVVKSMTSPLIRLKISKKRIGKSSHLNFIYKTLTSDILVQSDADVIFAHKNVIESIVKTFIKNPKVMMCGGNPTPLPAETFFEEAINVSTRVYEPFRSLVRGGNNVFSADGRLLGYRKIFAKKITVPSSMIANDMFTYFVCKSLGYPYAFVKNAVVYYRSPQYVKDHIRQDTRFRAAPIRMERYFDSNLVTMETSIPKGLFLRVALVRFFQKPIHCLAIFFVNSYVRYVAKKRERKMTAKWNMAVTTKNLSESRKNKSLKYVWPLNLNFMAKRDIL